MHLEAIQIQNPAAIRVLTLCAFLGTEAVTLDMFRPITDYEPSLFPAGSNVTSSLHELTEAAWSKFENKEVPGINEAISYFDKELQDNKGNLHDTLELLFTYSFATRRGKQGISVHPLVLMWAKERLSEAEKIQAARDAVVLVTDHHSRAFKMDLWIKREFSQYIHPLNVRCYQLVDEYLTEDPIYFDFPLFLAIERLAIDSSYSRDLINPLGLTAVIKTSWVGSRISDLSSVLLHYHPYLTLETPKYVIEDLANNSVTHAELLVIFNSLQYRNGSLDLEHFIAMRLLLNNDREAPVDLDRLTGRYSQVHERMRDLLNLLQLEERLEFLPKVDYAQKLADIVDAFHLHVLDVKDHVHGWKYGART